MTGRAVPDWMPGLAERARVGGLPIASLADAMRAAGEDPRDDKLWQVRLDQMDTELFARRRRRWRPRIAAIVGLGVVFWGTWLASAATTGHLSQFTVVGPCWALGTLGYVTFMIIRDRSA